MEPYLNLVNGQPAESIVLADRGLLYGDGVFRTLRVQAGQPLWWADHYAKLAEDCARLSIPCPSATLFEADIAPLLQADGVLRLTVTRGVGTRGYAPPEPVFVTRIVQSMPLPQDVNVECLARVHLCRLRVAQQPALAGIKHLNRLENCLARAEWSDPAIGEGLLLDAEGRMISGVSSNLFILRGDVLLTPRLDRCGVAGVARARLMACAPRLGLRVMVADLTPVDLDQTDALLFCNSVRGLRWTAALAGRCWTQSPLFAPLKEALWDV